MAEHKSRYDGYAVGLPNLILASTNIMALLPILTYYGKGFMWPSMAVALAALASVLYHLVECHKMSMPGILGGPRDRWIASSQAHAIFINIDRAFAVIAAITCSLLHIRHYGEVDFIRFMITSPWTWAALAGIVVSEQLASKTKRPILYHVTSHGIWHMAVFYMAYRLARAC